MSERLDKELASFKSIWKGGYYEGDPLVPLSPSAYSEFGFISILHAVYLMCIKPYVNKDTVALEIGPGRGAWTRGMLPSSEVWVMDALSAEHNKFHDYVGQHDHVKYFQVNDFACSMLPDDHFTYMFSFGCLCHVSFEGISEYARNLYPKLKSGADCFWMVADYDKWNRCIRNQEVTSIWNSLLPANSRKAAVLRVPLSLLATLSRRLFDNLKIQTPDRDNVPRPGRWFHAGVEPTCKMLESIGYRIVESDMDILTRDPIIHFRKP